MAITKVNLPSFPYLSHIIIPSKHRHNGFTMHVLPGQSRGLETWHWVMISFSAFFLGVLVAFIFTRKAHRFSFGHKYSVLCVEPPDSDEHDMVCQVTHPDSEDTR